MTHTERKQSIHEAEVWMLVRESQLREENRLPAHYSGPTRVAGDDSRSHSKGWGEDN